mmetsp:Transcript_69896/g.202573  ORF Transcript_69896/g.202573 Transcript_69896/m.202573 type:complete len:216 (+) Transcript_69896:1533-2180(+)
MGIHEEDRSASRSVSQAHPIHPAVAPLVAGNPLRPGLTDAIEGSPIPCHWRRVREVGPLEKVEVFKAGVVNDLLDVLALLEADQVKRQVLGDPLVNARPPVVRRYVPPEEVVRYDRDLSVDHLCQAPDRVWFQRRPVHQGPGPLDHRHARLRRPAGPASILRRTRRACHRLCDAEEGCRGTKDGRRLQPIHCSDAPVSAPSGRSGVAGALPANTA